MTPDQILQEIGMHSMYVKNYAGSPAGGSGGPELEWITILSPEKLASRLARLQKNIESLTDTIESITKINASTNESIKNITDSIDSISKTLNAIK